MECVIDYFPFCIGVGRVFFGASIWQSIFSIEHCSAGNHWLVSDSENFCAKKKTCAHFKTLVCDLELARWYFSRIPRAPYLDRKWCLKWDCEETSLLPSLPIYFHWMLVVHARGFMLLVSWLVTTMYCIPFGFGWDFCTKSLVSVPFFSSIGFCAIADLYKEYF
jgi:hypothetical protein